MQNKELKQELLSDNHKIKRYRDRMLWLEKLEKQSARPTFEPLAIKYDELQKQLNVQYPRVAEKTFHERALYDTIKRSTNLSFYRSVWIANRNVDMFCPAIGSLHDPVIKGHKIVRGRAMRGLVVEVDGPIHDSELKMRKDTSKYSLLHALDIGCCVIQNDQVNDNGIKMLLRKLKDTPRLDSRGRRRLLRKIYIATLAFHASDEVMVGLYGPQFLGLTVAK